jgi:hypothetical protein
MVDRTNAERQRRYIERLKKRAGGMTSKSPRVTNRQCKKAIGTILRYVEELADGEIKYDRAKFVALLTEVTKLSGDVALHTVQRLVVREKAAS